MNATVAAEIRADARLRLRLRQEIARASDGYYQKAEGLARRMKDEELKTAQVRNLENVAYTTDKVSDILDLVKKQIGRGQWPLDLGQDLLDALSERQAEARRIARDIDAKDIDLPRRIHLLLCREYVKHVAAHFIYLSEVK